MNPIQSQIFGLTLALSTAIGCIAYERLVKGLSFSIIILLALVFYVPCLFGCLLWNHRAVWEDLGKLYRDKALLMWAGVYVLAWITTPLWYVITKKQSVMVGSIYEVKYIVMLALLYFFMGSRPMTVHLAIGVALALGSIYCISRG